MQHRCGRQPWGSQRAESLGGRAGRGRRRPNRRRRASVEPPQRVAPVDTGHSESECAVETPRPGASGPEHDGRLPRIPTRIQRKSNANPTQIPRTNQRISNAHCRRMLVSERLTNSSQGPLLARPANQCHPRYALVRPISTSVGDEHPTCIGEDLHVLAQRLPHRPLHARKVSAVVVSAENSARPNLRHASGGAHQAYYSQPSRR
jgi:hypothetical protein